MRSARRSTPKSRLIVCITEGIPGARHGQGEALRCPARKSRLIGPNCPGVMTAGECKIGIHAGPTFSSPGKCRGSFSRSGTLTYEAVFQTTQEGLGQTTAVGIGGEPGQGHRIHRRAGDVFWPTPGTTSIVMIGEIGGSAERGTPPSS